MWGVATPGRFSSLLWAASYDVTLCSKLSTVVEYENIGSALRVSEPQVLKACLCRGPGRQQEGACSADRNVVVVDGDNHLPEVEILRKIHSSHNQPKRSTGAALHPNLPLALGINRYTSAATERPRPVSVCLYVKVVARCRSVFQLLFSPKLKFRPRGHSKQINQVAAQLSG